MMSSKGKGIIYDTFKAEGSSFKAFDPFLFFAHHNDQYPKGNANMGPDKELLQHRHIGNDFSFRDGWCMYHGETIPGFPSHPHRGFETISIVTKGLTDHADSMKCSARFGNGDTQWVTTGKGIQHSEMFPLLNTDKPNPLNLTQIWLNLPQKEKMCTPHFVMFWNEETPRVYFPSSSGANANNSHNGPMVRVVAGQFYDTKPLNAPPHSWAAKPEADVVVWECEIPANETLELPPARTLDAVNRTLYFLQGKTIDLEAPSLPVEHLSARTTSRINPTLAIKITPRNEDAQLIVLQGKPLNEKVVQHGPFVMNSDQEITQCFHDYNKTQFGGWPWPRADYVHPRNMPRHVVQDGEMSYPPGVHPAEQQSERLSPID